MQLLKRAFEPRRYQEAIFATAAQHNTLVVLPTGLGKTMISVMLALHRLKQHPRKKVLMLAPTRPLVQQHARTFEEFIDIPEEGFATFTGNVRPKQREELWQASRVIFSTPQGLENDVLGNRISLKDVSLIVFDEAHRATGDYSYVYLAKQFAKQSDGRVLGLTASPGTDEESITEVCQNLSVEEIEVRSTEDEDVKPYVQELDVHWEEVEFPKALEGVRRLLKNMLKVRTDQLKTQGFLEGKYVNKRALLGAQKELQSALAQGERTPEVMMALSAVAETMKIYHAAELLDTQGIYALRQYMRSLQEKAAKGQSKAVKRVVEDSQWKAVRVKLDTLKEENEHPKLTRLREIILDETSRQKDVKIIIFTQYRDQAVKIRDVLDDINVQSEIFVGQMKKGGTGMSQKEQKEMLERFSTNDFPVLIATSVAEEGLDIPKVDLVMFYEPIPSAIRTVQRRGRTGRGERGRVIVLMTKGTSDVGYKWAAHHKEKRMYRAIRKVKKKFRLEPEKEQKTLLQKYWEGKKNGKGEQYKIVCDYREKASPVMKILSETGVEIDLQQLSVGDYQLSDRTVVEYKTVPDFVDSIVDGRLLGQLKSMKQYTRPIIIVEGTEDIYAMRKINPNAIRGMLATITVSYNIPVLRTSSPQDTAGVLLAMARREQRGGQEWQYHSAKPLTDDELREYIVAGFPGIGSQLARPLLEKFGSIKGVIDASEDDLKAVRLIGDKKAKRLKEVAEGEYKEKNEQS